MSSPALEVDRYVLCEPLAVGGMATVYFARQRGAAGFAKTVVVKRMRPDLVHQREFVELFVDEARLASRVRHANVVGVTDVVASGEELLLVMDYFHGESLARVVAAAKKPTPPDVAVAIVAGVLRGLHAAHEAVGDDGEPLGIVHRDVSPQNILVCADGIARVVDFGIARAAGQLHATDEGKTRGKAAYSAPEQLRGGEVTRRIDVFAAGAVLWELLAGERLFDGDSQGTVIAMVLTQPIDPPGLRVPSVPEALDDVVMRALERDPRRRFATALDFANELERAVAPAGPGAVSAWLREHCAGELSAREAVVRRVQSGRVETPRAGAPPLAPAFGAASPITGPSAPPMATGPVAPATSPLAGISTPGTTPGPTFALGPPAPFAPPPDLATGSLATSRSATTPPPSQQSRGALLAVGLVAFVVVLGLGAFGFRAVREPASPTPPEAPPTAPEATSAPAPDPTSTAAPDPTSTAAPEPTPETTASSAPPPTSTAPVPVGPRPRPRPTPKPPKGKNCDPPWDIDAAGRRIFKPECL